MSALMVIPARLGATRLPQKPLRLLGGKPLIVRVLERSWSMGLDVDVVVATDAEPVAKAVRAAGGTAVLTRDTHLSGTERIAEVVSRAEYRSHDIIVNVQGDEPFLTAETVRAAMACVQTNGFPLGTAACRADASILDQPNIVKVVADSGGRALYFSRAAIPHLRDDADQTVRDSCVLRHIGVYAYTREALGQWVALPPVSLELVERLEQLRPLTAGIAMGVGVTAAPAAGGIDTEEDLRQANAGWSEPDISARSPVTAGIR